MDHSRYIRLSGLVILAGVAWYELHRLLEELQSGVGDPSDLTAHPTIPRSN